MNPNQQQNQPFQPSVPPQYQQPTNVSGSMLPHKQSKLPLILAVVFGLLFVIAAGFGLWAFSERQDYKNNSDAKSAAAVEVALSEQKEQLSAEFAEQAKEPFLTYSGPSTYGSFTFDYPRTWSVYVEESSNSSELYTVYMNPGEIRDVSSRDSQHALIVQVVGSSYENEIKRVESDVERGDLTAASYRPPLVESVLGLRARGEVENDIQGQRVYLPIRDRTLILTTETDNYAADFDKILSTLTFTP